MKKAVLISFLITLTVYIGVESYETGSPEQVQVTRIIDGDTIEVATNGRTESVRFIGMDTPEIHGENNPKHFQGIPNNQTGEECLLKWAEKSTEYVEQKISPGDQIELRYEGDRRDQYQRLRAHIHLENHDKTLNYKLVEKGYANVFPVEFEEKARFEDAEQKARQQRKGLWTCKI